MDRYDEEIKQLTQMCQDNPSVTESCLLYQIWGSAVHDCMDGGISYLFYPASKQGKSNGCGCPVQVQRGGTWLSDLASTPEITDWIRNQPRLPRSNLITLADLPAFADMQCGIDDMIPDRWD